MNILDDIDNLVLEMQSPNVVFSQQVEDIRDFKDIDDLYEFIDRVNEDKHLTFVEKNQLIEGRLSSRRS